jgi:hypothetical protein
MYTAATELQQSCNSVCVWKSVCPQCTRQCPDLRCMRIHEFMYIHVYTTTNLTQLPPFTSVTEREKERERGRKRERKRHCSARICPPWEYMFVRSSPAEVSIHIQSRCSCFASLLQLLHAYRVALPEKQHAILALLTNEASIYLESCCSSVAALLRPLHADRLQNLLGAS